MKKTYQILTLFALATLVSCGGGSGKKQSVDALLEGDDLKAITAKKEELKLQNQEIEANIKRLEEKIQKLNPTEKFPLVTTLIAKDSVFNHYLELQGNVQTKQNLVITPEANGILTKVFVKEGQRVSKGQILGRIDDGGLSQQLSQLQIQADLAKTTFERQKRLWDQKIGSEIQYLQAKSTYETQQEAVNQLKVQIGKTAVRAPFSGIVDDVITEQGSVVAAGQSQLIRIVNLRDMYVEAAVPEKYLTNVVKGKKVDVYFPILGETVEAKIRQAGDFIDPNNRTYKVEIPVSNKKGTIKPNLTAKLKINDYTNPKAILIPQSIISEDASGQQYVYIATEAKQNFATVKRVIIATGKTQGDYIEVIKGLSDGNAIIQEGARSVKDGQKVELKNL